MTRPAGRSRLVPGRCADDDDSQGLLALENATITLDSGLTVLMTQGSIAVPCPIYLIEHSRGLALFDTGVAPANQRIKQIAATHGADIWVMHDLTDRERLGGTDGQT